MAHISGPAAAAYGQLVPAAAAAGTFYVGGDNAMPANGAGKLFSQLTNADTIAYKAVSLDDPTKWEIGLATYTSATTILTRTTVVASSNSNNAVNFKRSDSAGGGLVLVEGMSLAYVADAYTITAFSADRALAGTEATAANVAATLATLINDLILAGVIRGTVAA